MLVYNNLNKDVFADPNENYNLLEEIITDTMNKSIHTVIQTPWITQGIIKSIKFRDKLYFKMKQTPVNTQQYITLKINLKTYNGIFGVQLPKLFKKQQLVVSFLTILKLMETL